MSKVYSVIVALIVSLTAASGALAVPDKAAAAGDSITKGIAADCTGNINPLDLLCLLFGDKAQYSWFDGSSSSVSSIFDKYKVIAPSITANQSAAISGAEMRGGFSNFSSQADSILNQNPVADHVEVLLGSNDICSRSCVDPDNCRNPLYTEEEWRQAVTVGLDKLVNGLPDGASILLGSIPRVQDIRAAGLDKQANDDRVNCENIWQIGICGIVTNGGTLNGEDAATRFEAVNNIQRRYNEITRALASEYNGINGVEVVAEYTGEDELNGGTFKFGKDDINGTDCFHPSIQGQNIVADIMWLGNPDNPEQ